MLGVLGDFGTCRVADDTLPTTMDPEDDSCAAVGGLSNTLGGDLGLEVVGELSSSARSADVSFFRRPWSSTDTGASLQLTAVLVDTVVEVREVWLMDEKLE